MSFFEEIYQKNIEQNEKNIKYWEDYLKNLQSLDFKVFGDRLKVPALIPIGSRVFFRGELKHTNEVTVALGTDYFVKCSLKQAEVLKQHRIKRVKTKLDSLQKEREYLDSQLLISKKTIEGDGGQEIIEVHNEEEDRVWRQQHRENVKRHKQAAKEKRKESKKSEITDEELWNRLEELELQEEFDQELASKVHNKSKQPSSFEPQQGQRLPTITENPTCNDESDLPEPEAIQLETEQNTLVNSNTANERIEQEIIAKQNLLKQVIEKQNELEVKLFELKKRETARIRTEQDLLNRLDEIDELDELQDDMLRLNDMVPTNDIDEESGDSTGESEKDAVEYYAECKRKRFGKKKVSFAEEDADTLEVTFHHCDVEPNTEPYDPEKGIMKPSDIYEAYPNLFNENPTSILKKPTGDIDHKEQFVPTLEEVVKFDQMQAQRDTIIVRNVTENVGDHAEAQVRSNRPVSLFKKRRLLMKE